MDIRHIPILTNVIIAISAVFGVAGASAYYMKQISGFSTQVILQSIFLYILTTVFITLLFVGLIQKWQTE